LILALLGALAAMAVGFLSLRGLLRIMPEHFLPVDAVHLDSNVLAFTLLVSLLTSVLFGMLPALSYRRIDLRSAITSHAVIGARSVGVRQALIAGEVALTIVLLSAAGLLIRTLIHLETLPPGFNPVGLITAQASLDDVRYHDAGAFRKLLNESITDMRKIPGVQNAAVAMSLPYQRAAIVIGIVLADGPQAGKKIAADQLYVTPGYFDTLQIPILMGRAFRDADGPDSQHVIIVNQTFARKFFPGENPVGRYVKDQMIIGVVGDTVLTSKLYEGAAPLKHEETIYLPAAQVAGPKLAVLHAWFQPSWIVRSERVDGVNPEMQKALAAADPGLPFSGFYSMNDLRATTLAMQRIEVALLAAMASLALLLSGVGIFALVANTVVQRRREIGIRIALGSTIGRAMVHIGRSGVTASAVGLILGLLLCAGMLRGMRSVIYGVSIYDAPTIFLVIVMLFAVTVLATVVPSLSVASTDAARTLRED
jgi:predicted permease